MVRFGDALIVLVGAFMLLAVNSVDGASNLNVNFIRPATQPFVSVPAATFQTVSARTVNVRQTTISSPDGFSVKSEEGSITLDGSSLDMKGGEIRFAAADSTSISTAGGLDIDALQSVALTAGSGAVRFEAQEDFLELIANGQLDMLSRGVNIRANDDTFVRSGGSLTARNTLGFSVNASTISLSGTDSVTVSGTTMNIQADDSFEVVSDRTKWTATSTVTLKSNFNNVQIHAANRLDVDSKSLDLSGTSGVLIGSQQGEVSVSGNGGLNTTVGGSASFMSETSVAITSASGSISMVSGDQVKFHGSSGVAIQTTSTSGSLDINSPAGDFSVFTSNIVIDTDTAPITMQTTKSVATIESKDGLNVFGKQAVFQSNGQDVIASAQRGSILISAIAHPTDAFSIGFSGVTTGTARNPAVTFTSGDDAFFRSGSVTLTAVEQVAFKGDAVRVSNNDRTQDETIFEGKTFSATIAGQLEADGGQFALTGTVVNLLANTDLILRTNNIGDPSRLGSIDISAAQQMKLLVTNAFDVDGGQVLLKSTAQTTVKSAGAITNTATGDFLAESQTLVHAITGDLSLKSTLGDIHMKYPNDAAFVVTAQQTVQSENGNTDLRGNNVKLLENNQKITATANKGSWVSLGMTEIKSNNPITFTILNDAPLNINGIATVRSETADIDIVTQNAKSFEWTSGANQDIELVPAQANTMEATTGSIDIQSKNIDIGGTAPITFKSEQSLAIETTDNQLLTIQSTGANADLTATNGGLVASSTGDFKINTQGAASWKSVTGGHVEGTELLRFGSNLVTMLSTGDQSITSADDIYMKSHAKVVGAFGKTGTIQAKDIELLGGKVEVKAVTGKLTVSAGTDIFQLAQKDATFQSVAGGIQLTATDELIATAPVIKAIATDALDVVSTTKTIAIENSKDLVATIGGNLEIKSPILVLFKAEEIDLKAVLDFKVTGETMIIKSGESDLLFIETTDAANGGMTTTSEQMFITSNNDIRWSGAGAWTIVAQGDGGKTPALVFVSTHTNAGIDFASGATMTWDSAAGVHVATTDHTNDAHDITFSTGTNTAFTQLRDAGAGALEINIQGSTWDEEYGQEVGAVFRGHGSGNGDVLVNSAGSLKVTSQGTFTQRARQGTLHIEAVASTVTIASALDDVEIKSFDGLIKTSSGLTTTIQATGTDAAVIYETTGPITAEAKEKVKFHAAGAIADPRGVAIDILSDSGHIVFDMGENAPANINSGNLFVVDAGADVTIATKDALTIAANVNANIEAERGIALTVGDDDTKTLTFQSTGAGGVVSVSSSKNNDISLRATGAAGTVDLKSTTKHVIMQAGGSATFSSTTNIAKVINSAGAGEIALESEGSISFTAPSATAEITVSSKSDQRYVAGNEFVVDPIETLTIGTAAVKPVIRLYAGGDDLATGASISSVGFASVVSDLDINFKAGDIYRQHSEFRSEITSIEDITIESLGTVGKDSDVNLLADKQFSFIGQLNVRVGQSERVRMYSEVDTVLFKANQQLDARTSRNFVINGQNAVTTKAFLNVNLNAHDIDSRSFQNSLYTSVTPGGNGGTEIISGGTTSFEADTGISIVNDNMGTGQHLTVTTTGRDSPITFTARKDTGNIDFEAAGNLHYIASDDMTINGRQGLAFTAKTTAQVVARDEITLETSGRVHVESTLTELKMISSTEDVSIDSPSGIQVTSDNQIQIVGKTGVTFGSDMNTEITATGAGMTGTFTGQLTMEVGRNLRLESNGALQLTNNGPLTQEITTRGIHPEFGYGSRFSFTNQQTFSSTLGSLIEGGAGVHSDARETALTATGAVIGSTSGNDGFLFETTNVGTDLLVSSATTSVIATVGGVNVHATGTDTATGIIDITGKATNFLTRTGAQSYSAQDGKIRSKSTAQTQFVSNNGYFRATASGFTEDSRLGLTLSAGADIQTRSVGDIDIFGGTAVAVAADGDSTPTPAKITLQTTQEELSFLTQGSNKFGHGIDLRANNAGPEAMVFRAGSEIVAESGGAVQLLGTDGVALRARQTIDVVSAHNITLVGEGRQIEHQDQHTPLNHIGVAVHALAHDDGTAGEDIDFLAGGDMWVRASNRINARASGALRFIGGGAINFWGDAGVTLGSTQSTLDISSTGDGLVQAQDHIDISSGDRIDLFVDGEADIIANSGRTQEVGDVRLIARGNHPTGGDITLTAASTRFSGLSVGVAPNSRMVIPTYTADQTANCAAANGPRSRSLWYQFDGTTFELCFCRDNAGHCVEFHNI